jgi:hypothetical protein
MVSRWGPPTWNFFHTLAEKINEDKFSAVFPQVVTILKQICRNLPCPDCANHATQFLEKVNFANIKTKSDFKNIMYFFHNTVNRRKRKTPFDMKNLELYGKNNIITAYNNFIAVYHTSGNMKLLADSFQRKIIVNQLKKWMVANIQFFI